MSYREQEIGKTGINQTQSLISGIGFAPIQSNYCLSPVIGLLVSMQ